jgi:hypothetical protein
VKERPQPSSKATTGILEAGRFGKERCHHRSLPTAREKPRSGHGEGRGASHGRRDGPELAHDSGGGALPAADECRRWRGVTDRTLDLAEAVDAAKRARHAVLAYRQVLAMTRPEPEKSRVGRGSTLPRMRWQRVAFDAATKGQRAAVAVNGATGCRPAEIERAGSRSGVMVMPWSSKYRARRSRQTGADLPDAVDPASEVGRIIAMMLGNRQGARVQRKAKRIAADFVDIRRRSGLGRFRLTASGISRLPDMKGRGDDPVKIAEALGMLSTRTQSRYGSPLQRA